MAEIIGRDVTSDDYPRVTVRASDGATYYVVDMPMCVAVFGADYRLVRNGFGSVGSALRFLGVSDGA